MIRPLFKSFNALTILILKGIKIFLIKTIGFLLGSFIEYSIG